MTHGKQYLVRGGNCLDNKVAVQDSQDKKKKREKEH